ncbi:hemagglutinin repeat-containing protein [Fusobacterium animalis]|uniref:two-partner secretion domain-containing protein n=2 Tax=Fusobacterium TaxID=848 RepID=UPI0030D1FBA3
MRNKFFRKFITIIFLFMYNIEIFAANLVVDPNSAHNTKLDGAPNGVPVVNISTPNNRGISINEFSEYNIDEKGQVLNNADNYGRSHLAGIISANPNLAPNQAANLIILQVNGSNRSQIEGYLEALSREKVDVILSNENGLYINNGGTINIKNFTATTGRVNLKDGDFVGIDVEKGNIVIGPKGMDGSNANYVELIAKTLELRGNVVTNDLKVVAGSNKIDKKGNITGKNNASNNIAIDGRELGGMYAGVIKIISTDKGAGVNSDAFIVSKNSKLEITADGKIKVNKVQGKGIDIKGKEYEQKDLAYSDEGISINADKIKLSGTGTQANKQINLNGAVENSATIYAKEGLKTKGLINTGTVQATNKIEVEGNLTNRGEILTNGNLTAKDTTSTKKLIAKEGVSVDKLENSGIVATDKKLDIKGNLINSGEVQAIDNIAVLENVNNSGEVLTNSSFSAKDVISTKKLVAKNGITTNKLENKGIVATDKNLNVNGDLNNKGKIQAANRIDVKNNIDNSGEIQTLDNINIKGNVVNTGDILTNGAFTSKDVKNEKVISVSKDINIGKLENTGNVSTAKNLNINGNLANSGNIQAVENISVTNNVLNKGTILTNGSFNSKDIKNEKELSVNKDITVSKLENVGNVVTNSKININNTLNNIGEVKAMDNITVSGDTTNNGSILTNKNFVTSNLINKQKVIAKEKIDIKNLKNSGTIASGDKFTVVGNLENTNNIETTNLDVTGNKLVNSGSIKADNISTKVSDITNDGKILSFNNITFSNAQNILNRNEITALKDIEANNTNLVNSGEIASNGKVLLNNSSIANTKKVASSTIEMKDNKKFDNTGEIIGNNVSLITTNDIDLVGKLHGAQSLTISGKNISNNGETTGTGTTTIKSNNFTNNKNLSALALTIKANNGNIVNNGELGGGTVNLTGKNIENNDLISAAGDLSLKAENKVENKSGKAIFAGNKLSITGKEILNNKNSELLGNDIELTADKVRNEVGTIKAFNDIKIKTDKFENIGEAKDLDKYESYYETWDGQILNESEVNDWKRYISPRIKSRTGSGHSGEKVRRDQRATYKEVTNKVTNDKYKSLLFPKYTEYMKKYLGNEGEHTEKTGSSKIEDIPLKEKVRSLSETEYGKVLAGGNITIEGKDGGNSQEVINKDAIISAGNTVNIDTDKLENIVSIGDKKIKVKTGEESIFIKYHRKKRRLRGDKISAEVTYTRDFADDYIEKKVPVLDKDGKPVLDYRGRPKYKKVKEYVGRYAYVTGSPSVIEGKNVIINPTSIVKQQIEDANGKINEGDPKNKVTKVEREVHQGIKKNIKEGKIDSNQINVKDELKKYGNVGANGAIYNGNNGINGQIAGSTKIIDEIIKNGKIDTDASLPSALFIKNVSPNSKYLLETRPKYINLNNFYGSDYFLSRISYEDKWNRVKRLGDAYYENELIERSITEKLGTRFLNGKEILAKDLMDNAAEEAKKNGLTIGKPLTKEQIAKLDKDIVWYEYQNVDGIQVLAPKIYLSQNTLKNLNTDTRSRITGIENTYVRTGNLENTGLIGGYGNTYVEAKEINNRTLGNQLAEIRGNNTTIIAQNNINNIGAKISANENLNLAAINGDILNKSTIEKVEFNNGEFDRSKFTKIDSVGEIVSNNNLNILTNNYTSVGAVTQAKNANINVANDINILSQETSGEQKFGKGDSQYNYYGFERNIGSEVKAENLNTSANNLNISGSAVTTKTADLNVDKLNIESKVDKEDEINKTSYKGFLKSGSKKETIHNEENSAGSLYVENKGLIKGDVNLVGSNLVLGNDSFVGGKVTTDSRELHSSYSLEEKKKGFSGSIGSGGFSIGYGKSESKLREKDLTNAKSNLVLGDGTTLNKGAEITATNLTHGNISINNGDVKFGARKDIKDVETSSKSSGINLSVRIKSQALDRAKQGVDSFKQMKSGDMLGGIASSTNTVTGLVQGLSSNITKKDGSKATLKDIKDGDFKVNNNFYANAGVNLGFTKSSSKTNSHNESAVVTTIRGKDENSSITYNNVKNIDYIGTQAQNTKFIYNNVDNITKKAVELNNSYSSNSKSNGISAGVTINYNNGFQAEADTINISASKSKMNTDGTNFQNGLFVDVDEVHNNTKNMTLSGFNQVGGKVTGNIQNLTIESKQNTSNKSGSSKSGSIGFAPNGMPNSISANYSKTNGERKYVDNATTFLIGDGSNLKVEKVENTAGAIGTTGNGKLSIDEYIGHNLENKDETTTKGASLSLSPNSNVISGVGINYANKDLESVTKNTVVGNVEIGKSSGDEINKDLSSMTEVTKDKDTKTDIFIESQTIKYALNPSQFKEDLQIALIEGKATGRTVVKTIDNMINGDKSQDIGEEERRSLIEIKEAIIRVQTAPAMDIIAKEDLTDKNVQKELGVVIEKFDPNDSTLSEKVKERLNELRSEGKEIVAFYDKVTGKIFVNKNAKDEEIRASIAREYKIKEDLELGRGKANDKGQLRSTVAGEIAYDEIKDRLKKSDKNPISASSFDITKMDKDSEVTSDKYSEKLKASYKEAGAASRYGMLYEELEESGKSPEEIKRILAKAKEDLKLEFSEINKELEAALDKEKKAKELLPKVYMQLSKTKNPNVRKALESYLEYLKRQSDTDVTFLYNVSRGTGIGLVEGTVGYYAAEAVGATMFSLVGISMLLRGDTRIEAPKENEQNTYIPNIPKENRITITNSEALRLKMLFPDYYRDRMNSFNILGLVKNEGIPRNTSTLENDSQISEDIAGYYNGEKSKLENKGYVVGNIIGNIAGYKLASEGAFYKNSSTYNSVENEIENTGDTAKTIGQNEKQMQIEQSNPVKNNNLNKPQVDINDVNNKQSTSVVANKIKNDYKAVYLTKPEQGETLVIGAGNNPIKGAYNIDIKENIKIGVFKGDATNLVNVPTGSQAKVIIENPNGFDPLNPEILRVVKEGGEIEITGIKSNKEFYKIYSGKVEVPKGFEIIEVGEIPENFQKQGFRTDGKLIGTKNGEGFPKKTDKIIRIRKIKK